MSGVETISVPPGLTAEASRRFGESLARASRSDARVLLLRSDGPQGAFCRGLALEGHEDGALEAGVRAFAEALIALRAAPQVTVALVEGACLGGGVGIAALSDWVLATHHATFALPELFFGLYPAMVYPCLLERMSPQRARALAFSCGSFDVGRAIVAGLVDEVASVPRSDDVVNARVRKFARLDPSAVTEFKRFAGDDERARRLDATIREGAARTLARLALPSVAQRLCAAGEGVEDGGLGA